MEKPFLCIYSSYDAVRVMHLCCVFVVVKIDFSDLYSDSFFSFCPAMLWKIPFRYQESRLDTLKKLRDNCKNELGLIDRSNFDNQQHSDAYCDCKIASHFSLFFKFHLLCICGPLTFLYFCEFVDCRIPGRVLLSR